MKKEYEGKIVFISLTVEEQDTPQTIAAKFPEGLHYARASQDAWTKLTTMGGVRNVLPTHALIQADGRLFRALEGGRDLEEAVADLAR